MIGGSWEHPGMYEYTYIYVHKHTCRLICMSKCRYQNIKSIYILSISIFKAGKAFKCDWNCTLVGRIICGLLAFMLYTLIVSGVPRFLLEWPVTLPFKPNACCVTHQQSTRSPHGKPPMTLNTMWARMPGWLHFGSPWSHTTPRYSLRLEPFSPVLTGHVGPVWPR